MLLLSIILPVYNVEKYLTNCLDSLLNQGVASNTYEIIIVIDGATDNSLKIANSYAEKNKHIQVVCQKNQGLGAARNTGIQVANGKYLLFVDSDDYLNTMSLKDPLLCMERQGLELLRFNYESVDEQGIIIPKRKNSLHSILYSEKVVSGNYFLFHQLGWACYAWQFIVRRDFIIDNVLFFNKDIYFEDVEWLVRVLSKAEKVASIDKIVYNYLQRNGSITRTRDIQKQEKLYHDKLFLLDFLNEQMALSDDKNVQKWCKGMQGLLIIGLFSFIKSYLPTQKKHFFYLLNHKKYRFIVPYRYTPKQWRDSIIINISPRFFYMLKG